MQETWQIWTRVAFRISIQAGGLAGFLQRSLKKLKEVLTQRTMQMLGLINQLTILHISLTTSKRQVEFLRMSSRNI